MEWKGAADRGTAGWPAQGRTFVPFQAILSNYRGTQVSGIPEAAIPNVLVRLARAAAQIGKMPHQSADTPDVYRALASALALGQHRPLQPGRRGAQRLLRD
jgi:hypothetical protein